MKRVVLITVILVLMGASGVLGGWLNRGISPDELDRQSRERVSLEADRFELTAEQAGEPLLVDKFSGDVVYDLTAATADTNIRIEHGFGDVTVIAPKGVGVRLYGRNDGIGQWTLSGFRPLGDYLVNDVYDEDGENAEVLLFRGAGSVRLVAAESTAAK